MKLSHLRRASGTFAGDSASRFLLSAMVLVWTLQIPIPVVHRHEQIRSSLALSEHLIERHPSGLVEGLEVDETHWHFVPPRSLRYGEDASHLPCDPPPDVSCQPTCVSAHGTVSPPVAEAAEFWTWWASPGELASVVAGSFGIPGNRSAAVGPGGAGVPCCAVLCVMRC